ncbi:hypothetical protein V2G26_000573 [Clonostachys chloroleuca]|uniref:Gpi-anchored protein n=1 Tax=Clonostachys chloroleuca TaxID=1926264 RepID=A0AA35QDM3_9HYPO|nr:unnamed protein product [Clonostachys chloroleuca]
MKLQAPLLLCGAALSSAVFVPEPTYAPIEDALFRRADDCPGNTFRCPTSLGAAFSDVCCANGQSCAFDNNNNPACCPSGLVCTGTAPGQTATGAATAVVSFVPNSYFSFPYAFTTYDDRVQCTSALLACSENYQICTSKLGGGTATGNGLAVTIAVPGGGGVTVGAPNVNLGASATSVCSSLSSQACANLEATPCDNYKESAAQRQANQQRHLVSIVAILVAAVAMG